MGWVRFRGIGFGYGLQFGTGNLIQTRKMSYLKKITVTMYHVDTVLYSTKSGSLACNHRATTLSAI